MVTHALRRLLQLALPLLSCAFVGCDAGGSLCPSCRPAPTSQNGSAAVLVDCAYQELPLTDELRARLRLSELPAKLERFSSPLDWGKPGEYDADNELLSSTQIDLVTELAPFRYLRGATNCKERVVADVTATWTARDGSLQARTQGEVEVDLETLGLWTLSTDADLAAVSGTLDVPIDDTRIHTGRFGASLSELPKTGIGGYLQVDLEYYDDQAAFNANIAAANSDLRPGGVSRESPIAGWLPAMPKGKLCEPGQKTVPNSVDDPCPQLGTACARAGSVNIGTCETWGKYWVCSCLDPAMP
ncbi:MAG TPA: hypothetical protein VJV78_48955 [Polyangiales bacterium]|nr:hypothetical protein [Polyangiales bacterium]